MTARRLLLHPNGDLTVPVELAGPLLDLAALGVRSAAGRHAISAAVWRALDALAMVRSMAPPVLASDQQPPMSTMLDCSGTTVEKAAGLLGAHPSTVRRWCRTGKLPAHRHGRDWIVEEGES